MATGDESTIAELVGTELEDPAALSCCAIVAGAGNGDELFPTICMLSTAVPVVPTEAAASDELAGTALDVDADVWSVDIGMAGVTVVMPASGNEDRGHMHWQSHWLGAEDIAG